MAKHNTSATESANNSDVHINSSVTVDKGKAQQIPEKVKGALGGYLHSSQTKKDELETSQQNKEQDVIAIAEALTRQEAKRAENIVLLKALAPQLEENEKQKRNFKESLMKYIIIILSIQLGFFLFVVFLFAFAFCFKTPFTNSISIEQLKHIIEFLKYYISAVIVEFIAMLFFIVKFVFDRSIVGLIKQLFKKDSKT